MFVTFFALSSLWPTQSPIPRTERTTKGWMCLSIPVPRSDRKFSILYCDYQIQARKIRKRPSILRPRDRWAISYHVNRGKRRGFRTSSMLCSIILVVYISQRPWDISGEKSAYRSHPMHLLPSKRPISSNFHTHITSPCSTPSHTKARTPIPHARPLVNRQAIGILPLTLPLRALIAILLSLLNLPFTPRGISPHAAVILRQTRVLAGLGDVGTGVAAALAAFLGGVQFERVLRKFLGDVVAGERRWLNAAYAFTFLVAGSEGTVGKDTDAAYGGDGHCRAC